MSPLNVLRQTLTVKPIAESIDDTVDESADLIALTASVVPSVTVVAGISVVALFATFAGIATVVMAASASTNTLQQPLEEA